MVGCFVVVLVCCEELVGMGIWMFMVFFDLGDDFMIGKDIGFGNGIVRVVWRGYGCLFVLLCDYVVVWWCCSFVIMMLDLQVMVLIVLKCFGRQGWLLNSGMFVLKSSGCCLSIRWLILLVRIVVRVFFLYNQIFVFFFCFRCWMMEMGFLVVILRFLVLVVLVWLNMICLRC